MNVSGAYAQQAADCKNFSFDVDSSTQCSQRLEQVGHQLQDQDSSSTQSTGQSHQEVSRMRVPVQCISAQSDHHDGEGKRVDSHANSMLSMGASEVVYPTAKVDCGQSVACFPYAYTDPFFNGMVTGYGPPRIIHPQMLSVTQPTRVPLPPELTEDSPIFVNAKQFNAIMRRRQVRAKLEAQNKVVKGRKPYLHESRHLHALKRQRGSGGRFLNTKQLQEQEQLQQQQQQQKYNTSGPISAGNKFSASVMLQLGGGWSLSESEILHSDGGNVGTSMGTSGSEISSISNSDDMFQIPDHLRYAAFKGGMSMMHGGPG